MAKDPIFDKKEVAAVLGVFSALMATPASPAASSPSIAPLASAPSALPESYAGHDQGIFNVGKPLATPQAATTQNVVCALHPENENGVDPQQATIVQITNITNVGPSIRRTYYIYDYGLSGSFDAYAYTDHLKQIKTYGVIDRRGIHTTHLEVGQTGLKGQSYDLTLSSTQREAAERAVNDDFVSSPDRGMNVQSHSNKGLSSKGQKGEEKPIKRLTGFERLNVEDETVAHALLTARKICDGRYTPQDIAVIDDPKSPDVYVQIGNWRFEVTPEYVKGYDAKSGLTVSSSASDLYRITLSENKFETLGTFSIDDSQGDYQTYYAAPGQYNSRHVTTSGPGRYEDLYQGSKPPSNMVVPMQMTQQALKLARPYFMQNRVWFKSWFPGTDPVTFTPQPGVKKPSEFSFPNAPQFLLPGYGKKNTGSKPKPQ